MFEPKPVEIVQDDDWTAHISVKPLVSIFSDLVISQLSETNPRLTPETLGYRLFKRDIFLRTGYYARPLALWAILRFRQKTIDVYWAMVEWLAHHSLIHFRTPEAMRIRWRDLGLGPDPRWKR